MKSMRRARFFWMALFLQSQWLLQSALLAEVPVLPTPAIGTKVMLLDDPEPARRGAIGILLKVVIHHSSPTPEDLFVIDYDDGPIVELRGNVHVLADQMKQVATTRRTR